MPVLAVHGLRGGAGVTAITAGISWALNSLGESVMAIDLSPASQMRHYFNMPADQRQGWMRAQCDNHDWQRSAMRYRPGLDFIPFGWLEKQEHNAVTQDFTQSVPDLLSQVNRLRAHYRWVVMDVSAGRLPWSDAALTLADRVLHIITPDGNTQLRLNETPQAEKNLFLINQFSASSRLQQDLHQVWLSRLNNLVPLMVHRDEAMAEALMMKQPPGEYRPNSMVAEELVMLANWLLLNVVGEPA